MQRKITISVDDAVYRGLHAVIGRGRISRFLNDLARPHVSGSAMEEAYRQKGADEAAEREALAWSEALIADSGDDAPHA